jgi:hypothetical protein
VGISRDRAHLASDKQWGPETALTVFVDPDGKIRKCVIEEPVDLDPSVIKRLEEDVRSTTMLPADRRGSPIGNVRRIEMFVQF